MAYFRCLSDSGGGEEGVITYIELSNTEYTYTIPKSGKYMFHQSVEGNTGSIVFKINNVDKLNEYAHRNYNSTGQQEYTWIFDLSAGDVIYGRNQSSSGKYLSWAYYIGAL